MSCLFVSTCFRIGQDASHLFRLNGRLALCRLGIFRCRRLWERFLVGLLEQGRVAGCLCFVRDICASRTKTLVGHARRRRGRRATFNVSHRRVSIIVSMLLVAVQLVVH